MYDPRAEESVGRDGHIPRSLLDPCPEGQKRSDKRAAFKSPTSQYVDAICRQETYFEPVDVDLILVALYPRSVDGPERNTLQLLDRSGSPAVERPLAPSAPERPVRQRWDNDPVRAAWAWIKPGWAALRVGRSGRSLSGRKTAHCQQTRNTGAAMRKHI